MMIVSIARNVRRASDMTCQCKITKQKMNAIEELLYSKGWAFVHRGEAIMLIQMTRDECRHKGTDKTDHCPNGACASGCITWEGRV